MTQLPELFQRNIVELLGGSAAKELFEALDTAPSVSIRKNPLKGGCHLDGKPIPWSEYGVLLSRRPQFTLDPAFHGGTYYVQESSSQFVDYLVGKLGIEGKRVLDMCAAPGGKTTIYSTRVGQKGLVLANEYVRQRSQILSDNAQKWGLGNIVVVNNDPRHIEAFEGQFDMVAVDAPCSGEGMFRKDDEARKEWSPENVTMCQERQMTILESAWKCLKTDGVLLYSTCTFNKQEDELLLQKFLDEVGESSLEEIAFEELDPLWGIAEGQVGPFRTYRFFPGRVDGEGMFIAIARRNDPARVRLPKPFKKLVTPLDKKTQSLVCEWDNFSESAAYRVIDGTIYRFEKSHADFITSLVESLHTVYAGVRIGDVVKQGIRPDWALSQYVGLNRDYLPGIALEDEEALNYLRRSDVFREDMPEGMMLVEWQNIVLGFAKRIGRRCNNLYPQHLRILNL